MIAKSRRYAAPIRRGVLDPGSSIWTAEFDGWIKENCRGLIVKSLLANGFIEKLEFTRQEDQALYLLSWIDPILRGTTFVDAAIFYCPYVPLAVTAASNHDAVKPVGFGPRYDTSI